MNGKPKFAFVHGVINVALPVLVVLAHHGFFGSVDNAWKLFWLGIAMAIVPIVSSVVGIVIACVQLKKTPESTIKAGLILSWIGLIMHIVFRFVLKI